MIKVFRSIFYVGQLHLSSKTQNLLKIYDQAPQINLPHLLNFSNIIPKPSFFSTLFQSKKHSELFQLYLNYVHRAQQTPSGIAYQYIEQNLRKKVLNELKTKATQAKLLKYKMLTSKLIEKKEIMGVFIHRKYNLNQQSYDLTLNSEEYLKYEFKSVMHSSALALYQKIIRNYEADRMKQLYGTSFKDFITQKLIVRYFYEVDCQIELQMNSPKESIMMGGQGPTKHVLQIESFFNSVSNLQQFYLVDVDYILKGNYFFRSRAVL